MNAKQRTQKAFARLMAKVQQALKENPDAWGFRFDNDPYSIPDGVTYTPNDQDTRPDFVKADDENWHKDA